MTKHVILVFFLPFLFSPAKPLLSIVQKGDLEFSTSASFTNRRWENGSESALVLPIRVGAFQSDRLEVEIEGLLSMMVFGNPAVVLSGLLSYNIPRPGVEQDRVYFLIVGLGVANNHPISLNFSPGGGDDYVPVLNLGTGIKAMIEKPVALRLEYRFQKYMGDLDRSNHMVHLGFSVFVR